MNSKNRGSALLVALVCATFSTPTLAGLVTGSQNVSGKRSTPAYGTPDLKDNAGNPGPFGPFNWDYSYTRSFDGKKLEKDIQINFSFDDTLKYTDAQKDAYIKAAKAGVSSVWDNKFAVKDGNSGQVIPIFVAVTTDGPFNQKVQVHGGNGRSDMTNWFIGDSASANAHEVGHMMGLFDEYIGGAVDKYPNPTLSNDGLMGLGALNANPAMYPRYYQQYYDYIKQLNPDTPFTLVAVPEPSVAMLLLGGGMFFWMGIYGRKRQA